MGERTHADAGKSLRSLRRLAWAGLGTLLPICTFPSNTFAANQNHYGVTISKAQTQNMAFSNGIFSSTGDHAVLNVGDLENALAAGNVEVTTGNGAGGDEKGDVHIEANLQWSSASRLLLDAFRAIFVTSAVRDKGNGAVTLKFGDGGKGAFLRFLQGGSISISRLSDKLTINGKTYALERGVRGLASAIASNPTGRFALAGAYDASTDGTYHSPPIPAFQGEFNGLGNAISNLTIRDNTAGDYVGLFGTLSAAKVSSIQLTEEVLSASGEGAISGGLAGWAQDSAIAQAGVTGKITGSVTGGLLGANEYGTVTNSFAIVDVKAAGQDVAGLVAYNEGVISQSWAAGQAIGTASNAIVGSLAGLSDGGTIEDSYSTGKVSARAVSTLGGLLGYNGTHSPVTRSYSIGHVDLAGGHVGGFVGEDNSTDWIQDCYWDTTTSGTDDGVGGGNESGVTGLTTAQLQAGLPDGFDPTVWAENPKINGGLPYLIANPPRQ